MANTDKEKNQREKYKLTDRTIKNLPIPKKDDKWYSDGANNLSLRINYTGSKTFVYKYRKKGSLYKATIGTYPITLLKTAREEAVKYARLREEYSHIDDIKKILEMLEQEERLKDSHTFINVFNEFANFKWNIDPNNDKRGITLDTALRNRREITDNVIPFIGSIPINTVNKEQVANILLKRAKGSKDKAKRIYGFLNKIFEFARAKGFIETNIIRDIDFKSLITIPTTKHHEAITKEPYFTELCNAIYKNTNITTKNILKFILHNPARAENARYLKWKYVNFDDRTIEIPRSEMKTKNPNFPNYKIYMSDETINILKDQKKHQERFYLKSDFVFYTGINQRSNTIATNTINNKLKEMGFIGKKKQTTHSFRQTYRTFADDYKAREFSYEAREMFLDHKRGDSVSLAYNHKATFEKELTEISKWWSDFILERISQ